MERFHLYNSGTLVASFAHDRTLLGDMYSNIEIFVPEQLPIRLRKNCTDAALDNWINRRSVPVNRHHMEAMLGALNLEKPFDLMRYSHALSLNDTFWIAEESEGLAFSRINLYDNRFDEALGWIAFTGLPSDISRNLSTPELTTVGMLPKYWQKIGIEDIILCKGGTSGYSNAGSILSAPRKAALKTPLKHRRFQNARPAFLPVSNEPYHEVAAHIIGKCLGIETIPYHLERRNGKTVSISKLFTTKEKGLITASEYIDYKSHIAGYKSLKMLLDFISEDHIDPYPFYEMCFLDYIIENFDRHLNNWGFSVDNHNQRITGLSPIWDNGMSLDYDKPVDMRERFDFASFNLPYDFVKDCEFTDVFRRKTNKLLTDIRSGQLHNQIYEAVNESYPSEELTAKTVAFTEERCMEFLKPLSLSPVR